MIIGQVCIEMVNDAIQNQIIDTATLGFIFDLGSMVVPIAGGRS